MSLPPLGGLNGATGKLTVSKTTLATGASTSRRPRTTRQRPHGITSSVGNSRELFDGLQRSQQVESELREQIRKLTAEARTLRTRLDDLRKAKTQTVVKREQAEDDWQRRDEACKCHSEVQELKRKLVAKDEEWQQRVAEIERFHREEVSAARLEAVRARPKTASWELLEVAQAEVSRLREVVSDLQARLQCHGKPRDNFLAVKSEVDRRLKELADQVSLEEKKFRDREIKLREEMEARCKATHQLWMADAKEALTMLSRENKELKQREESHRKLLSKLGVTTQHDAKQS